MISNRWFLFAAIVVVLVTSNFSLAQDEATENSTESVESSQEPSENPSPSASSIKEDPPPAPASSTLEKIDGVFAPAVDAIATVLFYRLGSEERDYVVFERSTSYQRPRGSSEPYQSIDPENPGQLTDSEVELLAARGQLLEGHTIDEKSQFYRLGEYEAQPVEYVVVKQNGPNDEVKYGDRFKLVKGNDEYQLIEKKRNLPADLTVSQDQMEQWNSKGFLKQNPDAGAGEKSYHFPEPVGGIPVVVAWLALGAVFFTFYMRWFNIWGFRHAVDIVRGKYDNPDETGEVTHFQALASALSATIGLGNIAGVTIAMTLGGPGAFFWMLVCGVFGMCTKFTECTLGQKYRHVKPDGTVLGGPMRYLKAGLDEMGLGLLGTILSAVFTVMCILASFGGGNMIQANQSGSAMLAVFQHEDQDRITELKTKIKAAAADGNVEEMRSLQEESSEIEAENASFETMFNYVYGIVLAIMVGLVILGGIKRIGAAASKIVPTMCIVYALACIYIIAIHITQVPALVARIFTEAFNGEAMGGGIIGVLVVGVQRAAFSNEAGAGSAAIAHSAAKTEEPVREGCVALLGPFIDTIIVCSMTALVILITDAWDNTEWVVEQGIEGAALTSRAFREEISWFPVVLGIATVLFAFSTIISWAYYGEKSWEMLFGARSTIIYKILTVICVFVGTVVNLGSVLDFSDMMILSMAFPNILGVVLLSPKVRKDLKEYWTRYQAGEFKTYR